MLRQPNGDLTMKQGRDAKQFRVELIAAFCDRETAGLQPRPDAVIRNCFRAKRRHDFQRSLHGGCLWKGEIRNAHTRIILRPASGAKSLTPPSWPIRTINETELAAPTKPDFRAIFDFDGCPLGNRLRES
jgi:hypothetical protein